MSYTIAVTQEEPRWAAFVRRTSPQKDLKVTIPEGCGKVWEFLRRTGTPHLGLNVALYHDKVMNVDCGVLVPDRFEGQGEVTCRQVPGGLVARTTHVGPYHLLSAAHNFVIDWCQSNGYRTILPCWEVYGHWNDDETKLETEVGYLVEKHPC